MLDRPHVLPEGTEVEVLPLSPPSGQTGEGLEKLAGTAKELPADLAEKHDHYRRERQT